MGRDLRIKLTDFDKLDFSRGTVVPRPRGRSGTGLLAQGAVEALKRTSAGPFVNSLQEFAAPPSGRLVTSGATTRVRYKASITDFTLAFGVGGNAGLGAQVNAGGGVYWWVKPGPTKDQIGLWGSLGFGVTTNAGFSGGGQFSIWYGPAPAVLAGESLAVSVDISVGIYTVTGSAFFSVPPAGFVLTPGSPGGFPAGFKPELIGLGFALSVGPSALPVDISVGPSYTWIKPLSG